MEHKCLHVCTPENSPQVESNAGVHQGRVTSGAAKTRRGGRRGREGKRQRGGAQHEACCRAIGKDLLKVCVKVFLFFFGLHQICMDALRGKRGKKKNNNHTFLNEKVEKKEKALALEIETFWRVMRI